MTELAPTTLLAFVLSATFLALGLAHYLGAPGLVRPLRDWGHPGWWPVLAGLVEMGGAVLVAVPQTRIVGLSVLLAVVGLSLALRLRAGALRPAVAAAVVALLLGVTAHQSALAG